MRVAFVNQPVDGVLAPHQNSLGIWTGEVARRLGASCDVRVYAKRMRTQRSAPSPAGVDYRFVRAIPNRAAASVSLLRSTLRPRIRLPFVASPLYCAEYAAQVAVGVRRWRADVVHIHNLSQLVPVLRALNRDAAIVLHMSCEWLSQLDHRTIERRLEPADLVVCASDYLTRRVRERFPRLAQRCRTIPNGADPIAFAPREADPEPDAGRLLFVGRVSPEKGVHVLIDAFARVAERHEGVRLDVVGWLQSLPPDHLVGLSDEPEVAALSRFYAEDYAVALARRVPSHLRDRVVFTGHVPHAHLPRYYERAAVVVNPSFSESFGMSLAEAMAFAKPVIATRVGGVPEVIEDGVTGVLVRRGDAGELAEAIGRLLADRDLRASMGRAGRRRAADLFSWDRVAAMVLSEYAAVGART